MPNNYWCFYYKDLYYSTDIEDTKDLMELHEKLYGQINYYHEFSLMKGEAKFIFVQDESGKKHLYSKQPRDKRDQIINLEAIESKKQELYNWITTRFNTIS